MSKKVRLTKATDGQKAAYRALSTSCYPLYGHAVVDGTTLLVEDLRRYMQAGEEPQYEVLAPRGTVFEGRVTHSLFAYSLADLREKLKICSLVSCSCGSCAN